MSVSAGLPRLPALTSSGGSDGVPDCEGSPNVAKQKVMVYTTNLE